VMRLTCGVRLQAAITAPNAAGTARRVMTDAGGREGIRRSMNPTARGGQMRSAPAVESFRQVPWLERTALGSTPYLSRVGGVNRLIRSVWEGRASKSFYLAIWLPLLGALWAGCFALAWRAFPGGYKMPHHDISFLGAADLNPHGWWYWSLGMGIASVMSFPLTAYASRRMEKMVFSPGFRGGRLVTLGGHSLRWSCLGMMGLALSPQGGLFDVIHIVSGVFAMGGMYLTLLFLWLVPLCAARQLRAGSFALFAFSAAWGVVGFLLTQGFRFFVYGELGRHIKHKSESVLLRFSLWEWMLFIAGTTSFALLLVLLPEEEGAKRGA
jgi:hypothetical protein